MASNKSYIQHLQADIVRWFSKDSEHMVIYYAKDGRAYPVTRDEQDRCIERANSYVEIYADTLYHRTFAFKARDMFKRCIAFVFFWPCLWMIASDLPFPMNFSGLAIFFVGFHFYEKTQENPHDTCIKNIKTLRTEFEERITLRNAVASRQKRNNGFMYMSWALVVIYLFMTIFVRIRMYFSDTEELIYLIIFAIIIFMFLIFSFLSDKIDQTNIRQTGKWFR